VTISVIIPAFNEERLLGETLRRVHAAMTSFQVRGWLVEVIVCDNNSNDRTAEVAREGGAKVVFEPRNQIGRARNRGAAAASGDWLIFLDADSHPSDGLFGAVADLMASGRCLAGGAVVQLAGHHPRGRFVASGWNLISRAMTWMAGSFIFCESRAFREIGGFDAELFASEELDLSRRLKRLARAEGKRVVILGRHPVMTSARKLQLYTPAEYARFLLKTVLSGGKTLRNRDACFTWYDGRR
jgi:glycosyltransferase involved in cell wall biosynthesis